MLISAAVSVRPASAGAAESTAGAAAACGGAAGQPLRVATVTDGRTLILADGREVRLAGIEVPPIASAGETNVAAAGGAEARAGLQALVAGANIRLAAAAPGPDRYGRLQAYVFVHHGGIEKMVQEALLAQGHARVAARGPDRACAARLLAAEANARTAGAGLWATAAFRLRHADEVVDISALRGRFAVIEGKIVSVHPSGGTIYMNFGRRWSESFTVTMLRRSEKAFTAAGLEPKSLAGRTVRVRGFVEERNGPRIAAVRPEQIELAERN